MADNAPTPPSPQSAPSSPAPAPQTFTPAPTTAAEMAASSMGSEPARPSFDQIEAALAGESAAAAKPNSATVPSADGSQAGTGAPVKAGTTEPAAQPASVTPPVAAQKSQREIELEAALNARNELFAQLTAPAAPAQPQAPKDPLDDIPQHQYQMPPEIMAGFGSEDPVERNRALTNYTSLVMKTLHREIRKEIQQFQQGLMKQNLPQMVQQYIEHQTQSRAIFEDFYNTHKDLNVPEMRQVILNTAMAIAKQKGYQSWSPEFRDEIATTIRQKLRMGAPAPAAAPAQPVMMNTTARPGTPAPTQQDAVFADIMSMASLNR